MSAEDPADPETPEPADLPRDSAEARRRRRERVFGEVLPESTTDDRDSGPGEAGGSRDDWYRENVPPHH